MSFFEVYRLHWLRARARALRWAEELKLTKHEMCWTVRFYMHMARRWKTRRDDFSVMRGHRAYAESQILTWNELGRVAEKLFLRSNPDYRCFWQSIV